MNTNEQIFQQALDDMYLSMMRVITLARGSMTAEQKLQFVMSALSGLTQGTPASPTSEDGSTPAVQPALTQPTAAPTAATTCHEIRYATMAEQRDSDDAWGFRNKYVQHEDGEDKNFCLYIIDDGQAEYELKITKSTAENLLNDPGIAANQVVKAEGIPAPDKHITVKERGRLIRDGKFWIVEKKCLVSWN